MTTRRVNVRGIIFKDDKIFAQTIKHGADESAYWCTPGGGLEIGESLHAGLHREMMEETGVAPVIGKLLFIQQFYDGTKEQLELFFEIKNTADYEVIDLANTSHGELEIGRCGFIDPREEHILPAFLQTADIATAINGNAPVRIESILPN